MIRAIARTLFASLVILGAKGEANEMQRGENIVNSRPVSLETILKMDAIREAEEDWEEEYSFEMAGLIVPIKYQNLVILASNNITGAGISSSIFHRIDEFPQDNLLKLEDGSEWIYDLNDSHILENWKPNHTIVISPKTRWFWSSNYSYVLTNKDLNTSVNANLYFTPIEFGTNSNWVRGIDFNQGLLHMRNGIKDDSIWEVYPSDRELLKEWQVNDTLIVGDNNSWLWYFSNYNQIIINVNSGHHIHVRQISFTPHNRPIIERG